MAKAYHIFEADTFPTLTLGTSLRVPNQSSLLEDILVPDTTFDVVTPNFHSGFTKCTVHYEQLVKVFGRLHDRTFNEFIRPFDFDAYVHYSPTFVAFAGKSEIVNDAVHIMNMGLPDFQLRRERLDLKKLLPSISYLKGAWWKVKNPNLSAQALFGEHVDRDLSFDQAMKYGDRISTLMLKYEYGSEFILSSILEACGIVFYESMQVEKELDIVLEVKQSLLDSVIIPDNSLPLGNNVGDSFLPLNADGSDL